MTHPIEPDLMDEIINLLRSDYETVNGNIAEPAKHIVEKLNTERQHFVVATINRGRPVSDLLDNTSLPMTSLSDGDMTSIADKISFYEPFDDELHESLYSALEDLFEKFPDKKTKAEGVL
jgi:hypothetical protein